MKVNNPDILLKKASKSELKNALYKIEQEEEELERLEEEKKHTKKYEYLIKVKSLLIKFLNKKGLDINSCNEWIYLQEEEINDGKYDYNLYFKPSCASNHLVILISKFFELFYQKNTSFPINSIEFRLDDNYSKKYIKLSIEEDNEKGLKFLEKRINQQIIK